MGAFDRLTGRLLGIAADPPCPIGAAPTPDPRARLATFRSLLLAQGLARSLFWAGAPGLPPLGLAASWLGLGTALALSLRAGTAHLAARVALPVLLAQLAWSFPFSSNHFWLELGWMAVLAWGDPRERDGAATQVALLRWLVALPLFHAGLQKLLFGQWWHGDFLAFAAAAPSRLGDFAGLLIPADELARLRGLWPLADGLGPFRAEAPWLVAVSRGVVGAELLLPGLLLWRRTRAVATWGALAFVAGLQLAAREVMFALLLANGLFLFPRGGMPRAVRALWLACLAYALAAYFDLVPGKWWLRPEHL